MASISTPELKEGENAAVMNTGESTLEKGKVKLSDLRVGVKVYVEKNGEYRKAEILAFQTKTDGMHFYVHYDEFNKRLDEWVAEVRIDLSKQVEWPVAERVEAPVKKTGFGGRSGGYHGLSTGKGGVGVKGNDAVGGVEQRGAGHRGFKKQRRFFKKQVKVDNGVTSGSVGQRSGIGSGRKDDRTTAGAEESLTGNESGEGWKLDTPGRTWEKVEEEKCTLEIETESNTVSGNEDKRTGLQKTEGMNYTRENELEKLRFSGSMTQNQAEISRVRNLTRIQMGQHEIEPWYFSPYPQEFASLDMVYICEFCLSYYGDLNQFIRHRKKCTLLHPPGNEIYRDNTISFFEIDGRCQRTWCRHLCLLSKLFLDHKTLYYDVDPFYFFCMCIRDEYGCHLVGYFSKEKESAEGYNVACILTLPQYQRKGYGKLLISFSYELSKRENKLGSPEKPLSDLGLLSYRAYWQETIIDYLMMNQGRKEASIEELANSAAMTTNDVLHTLQYLNMIKIFKNTQYVIVLPDAVVEQRMKQKEKEKVKGRLFIDPEKLQWKPPVLTASARTWNW